MKLKATNNTFLVAEVGLAHEGSLGIAKSFAKKAKECGADAIKFQHHNSIFESSNFEKFRKNFSYQDNTRQDYWIRTSFNFNQWMHLKNYCKKIGLYFICSPFSLESAIELNKVGVDYWKVASGEFTNMFLIEYLIKKTSKPIILSTGLVEDYEIKKVTDLLKKYKKKFYLLQCTSKYPTPLDEVGHSKIFDYKKKYNCRTGISDHSGNLNSLITAVTMGSQIIEFHVTFDKKFFGPDTSSSILFEDLKFLSKFRDDFYKIKKENIKKKKLINNKRKLSKLFKKSLYANKDILKGKKISKEDLIALKPNNGISVLNYKNVINKKISKTIKKRQLIKI